MNAIMTDFDFKRGSEPVPQKWEGLAELDRALAENRLTEYRIKKIWADPWARALGIVVICLFVAFGVFVVINDVIIGH
jgi:hypothetical protein